VKALVKGATGQLRKTFFGFFDDRHGNLIIRFLLHHPVVKQETKLIFDNTNLETQFLRDTGFAFVDSFGVLFKERKDLFVVRNGFTFHNSSENLIHLPFSMRNVFLDLCDPQINHQVRG